MKEATYKGKPISEMSRAELIKALEQMTYLYQQALIEPYERNT